MSEDLAHRPAAGRYHGLDALRASAMLLGIALHAALSFADIPWIITDRHTHPAFQWAFEAIHVFRMPLFFVMSGFFTAMLVGRRGLGAMVSHRVRRIVLPLSFGAATIIPLTFGAFGWAGSVAASDSKPAVAVETAGTIWTAAMAGDVGALNVLIDAGADPEGLDPRLRTSPLGWAAIGGHADAAAVLLDRGADPNQRYGDNNTALHSAAFFGRAEVARRLLDAGADPESRNVHGERPIESAGHDRATTEWIAGLLGVEIDFGRVSAGRDQIREMLAVVSTSAEPPPSGAWRTVRGILVEFPFFMHLWFLWHLCWFITLFALATLALRHLPTIRVPRVLVATPLCLAVLIPVTAFTQSLQFDIGPDTSSGFIPMPQVLLHYGVYFFAGVFLYAVPNAVDRLGRTWWAYLSVAAAATPVMLALHHGHPWLAERLSEQQLAIASPIVQSVFAWTLIVGLTGLCQAVLTRERPWVRYLSDSSYWLYLAHLPLIIAGQVLIRNIDAPAPVKFAGLLVVSTAVLLASYQWGVRYTIIGRLLNGPRTRPVS